jgi:hypothetical protein
VIKKLTSNNLANQLGKNKNLAKLPIHREIYTCPSGLALAFFPHANLSERIKKE